MKKKEKKKKEKSLKKGQKIKDSDFVYFLFLRGL